MQLIISLFLIAASLAGFFGFISPEWNTTQGLKKQQAAYEDVLVKAAQAQTLEAALQAKYDAFSPTELTSLQKVLPDTVDNIRLLLDLNQIALAYGANISGVHIDTATDAAQAGSNQQPIAPQNSQAAYGSLGISFAVNMSYENFLKFMGDIQRNLRLTDITSIAFASTENGKYNFTVGMKTYWLK